jgi:hypothetical protein
MSENLCAAFYCESVDQSELEQLLLTHFGGSWNLGHGEVHYGRGGTREPALVVKYSKDGAIVEITAGPTTDTSDVASVIEKVERYLLQSNATQIGQTVLFAIVPTRGGFRYKDVFQLVPVPPEAPRPPFFIGDHPLLLQYQVASSTDYQTDMLRRSRVGRELELLCVALNARMRGGIGMVARYHWSLVGDLRDPVNWRSEYCQEAYMYPGANGIAPTYSSIDGLEAIASVPAQTHYTRIGLSGGEVLDVPDTFEQSLDTYFAMPRDNQERFIRACFWFQYAQRVATLSHSGAFTALVSAVESLMGDAKPEGHCEKCSRPIGAGPTRRFIEFVEQYAPGPAISNSHRRQLYSLRSALAHGGHLLHADRFGWGGGMTANALSEETDQRALWHAVRLVLVNWLSAQAAN